MLMARTLPNDKDLVGLHIREPIPRDRILTRLCSLYLDSYSNVSKNSLESMKTSIKSGSLTDTCHPDKPLARKS